MMEDIKRRILNIILSCIAMLDSIVLASTLQLGQNDRGGI